MARKSTFLPVLLAASLLTPVLAAAGTFSIVALPDTQYYNGDKSFVFQDQTTWIKKNAANYNIQLVVGLGDITDNGGGANCANPLPAEAPVPMFSNASTAYGVLDSANIPYMAAIGNHDYDCHEDIPIPRGAAIFNQYFGPSRYTSKSWFDNGQHGWYEAGTNENFYNTFTINGRSFLVMVLEFFPRDSVLTWANGVVSLFPNSEVIVVTHAYLNYDALGSPGTGPRLATGMGDSAASYYPNYATTGIANNGIDMWTKFVSLHPNIRTVLSGHIRSPNPGNTWTANNGVGYRTDLNSAGQHINQILADYQGQGMNGYFGFGYLRIYTFDDTAKTLKVQTYSPAITMDSTKMASLLSSYGTTVPAAWKTDAYNTFTLPYDPMTSYAPPSPGVTISSPLNGSTASSPVTISATANESVPVSQMQVWIDGNKLTYVSGATVNTTAALANGAHAITVLDLNSSNAVINKSVVSVTVGPSASPSPVATGVTISSPVNGATVSSPVTITATAHENVPISQMQVWVDRAKLTYVMSSTVSTTATLAAGSHRIAVTDLNSSNAVINETVVNITVP
jgi:hypothetical protein